MSIKIDLKIFLLLVFLFFSGQSKIYLIVFAFTILHEIGHLICGIILGLKPKDIKLMPLGLSILFKEYKIKWWKELLIALSGPMLNLGIAIISSKKIDSNEITYVNLLIGMFNLIPVIPLDGGRAIKAILRCKFSAIDTNHYVNIFSIISMIFVSIIGIIFLTIVKNILILPTIIYLWVVTLSESKKMKIQTTIQNCIDSQNKY